MFYLLCQTIPTIDAQATWFVRPPPEREKLLGWLYKNSFFRLSQTGKDAIQSFGLIRNVKILVVDPVCTFFFMFKGLAVIISSSWLFECNLWHWWSFVKTCSLPAGHTLYQLCNDDTATYAERLQQQCCSPVGQERAYEALFVMREMRTSHTGSYLMNTYKFCNTTLSMPSQSQMYDVDRGTWLLLIK